MITLLWIALGIIIGLSVSVFILAALFVALTDNIKNVDELP